MNTVFQISLLSVEAIALVMLALWGYALLAPSSVSTAWRIGSAAWGLILFIVFLSIIG